VPLSVIVWAPVVFVNTASVVLDGTLTDQFPFVFHDPPVGVVQKFVVWARAIAGDSIITAASRDIPDLMRGLINLLRQGIIF